MTSSSLVDVDGCGTSNDLRFWMVVGGKETQTTILKQSTRSHDESDDFGL